MPRWNLTLTEEQRWYIVNYLKTLPGNGDANQNRAESLEELKKMGTIPTYEERHN